MFSSKAKENVTAQAQPFENFEEVIHGLFGVSKQEIDAKLSEEKAKRQAERERKALERRRQEGRKP